MNDDFTIGLDLGGTQVRAALVRAGRVLARTAARTDVSGPEEVMRQFGALVTEVSRAAGSTPVHAIGMCAPGPLDTVSGVIDHIPTLPGWEQFPLCDRLSELFGLPAIVENDGIVILGRGLEPALLAIPGDVHDIAGLRQGTLHVPGDGRLILDEKDPHQRLLIRRI